jgi:hypothetical protein
VVIRQLGNVLLDHDLGCAVRGHGVKGRVLIQQVVATGAVVAAGRREDESLHAGLLGQLGQLDRCRMVDLEGQTRIQVAQGIVRKAGKMENGVKALHILQGRITNVFADLRYVGDPVTEGAALEKVSIEPNYFMPCLQQHWH